jgi:hypothetical protein
MFHSQHLAMLRVEVSERGTSYPYGVSTRSEGLSYEIRTR